MANQEAIPRSESLTNSLEVLKNKFAISSLRDYQEDFFKLFAHEGTTDFFIAQPTGSGKSLLFQGISCFIRISSAHPNSKSITALVVCPLNALVDDQIELMAKKDVVSKHLCDDMVR